MSDVIKSALTSLIQGERPGPDSIRACFEDIMNGEVSEAQMGAFLIALRMRGEQVADIAAAATVMREKATTITASDATMDIVGTGGDGFGTYNISTASALLLRVAAYRLPNMAIKRCRHKAAPRMCYPPLASNLIVIFLWSNRPLTRPILPF